MNAAAIVRTLWPGMRRILVAIGRWVVGMVRRRGGQLVAHYMEGRLEVFAARLKRARTPRRKRWLRGRIRRWRNAARWLLAHATKLNAKAAALLERLAIEKRIPERAPLERLR